MFHRTDAIMDLGVWVFMRLYGSSCNTTLGRVQGNRVNEFSNIFTAVSGAGVPARLPPKAAEIHPATYFGRVCDARWRRQAGGGARPTENFLPPIALSSCQNRHSSLKQK